MRIWGLCACVCRKLSADGGSTVVVFLRRMQLEGIYSVCLQDHRLNRAVIHRS